MTSRKTRPCSWTLLLMLSGWSLANCTTSGPFVPDMRERVGGRQRITADDVFKRAPWELWRVPTGTARYHRETKMLLPDQLQSFEVREVSVYQADGSDVRIDYFSVDLGGGSQAQESIAVYVYRAPDSLDGEWKDVVEHTRRRWPGATTVTPLPVPEHHPEDTKAMALIAGARGGDLSQASFVQTMLFHVGTWAVRYDVICPAADVEVTREKTRTFLRSLRAEEYADRTE